MLFVGAGDGLCCHLLGVCGGGPLLLLVVGGGGPSLPFVGAGSGPSSLLVVVVLVGPHCCWWGVVMGHWWVVVVVGPGCCLCCCLVMACCRHCVPSLSLSLPVVVTCLHLHHVLPGLHCVVIGHLVLGLANSKGEGGLTLLLFIVWWLCRYLQCGNLGCCCCCLVSMWLVVRLVTWQWWVVGIMGGGIEEVKVVTRWGCVGVVDDGGG